MESPIVKTFAYIILAYAAGSACKYGLTLAHQVHRVELMRASFAMERSKFEAGMYDAQASARADSSVITENLNRPFEIFQYDLSVPVDQVAVHECRDVAERLECLMSYDFAGRRVSVIYAGDDLGMPRAVPVVSHLKLTSCRASGRDTSCDISGSLEPGNRILISMPDGQTPHDVLSLNGSISLRYQPDHPRTYDGSLKLAGTFEPINVHVEAAIVQRDAPELIGNIWSDPTFALR